ncbi:MAG: hypothetical protein RJA10_2256 [Pseudomonadota bacterium]|jgi:diguanylate cyclase (GGDEF)-like protein
MTNAQLLLSLILIQQGVLGVVWLGAAALGLARRPALHFGAAAALGALSLAGVLQRGPGNVHWLTWLLPSLGGVLSFVLLRRGVQLFCKLPLTDREHAAVVVLSTLAQGLALATGQPAWMLATLTSAGLAWSLLRASAEGLGGLHAEFGRGAAVACMAPLAAVGALFALRAALLPVFAEEVGRSALSGGAFNAVLGLVLLSLVLMQNLALGAMVVMRAVSQLQRLSDHDALTGVLNRRGLAAHHERERSRLRRGGIGFALLLVDIDHFKRINDDHGHSVGDQALVAVASALRAAMRPGDVVARTGGEEFCVLLADVDPPQALRAAQRLREAVRGEAVVVDGLQLSVTCSIGVAWTADPADGLDALSLRADEAMYRAKALGRDRVVAAGGL